VCVVMNKFLPSAIFAGILAVLSTEASAADVPEFDPETVDVADVTGCKIDAGHYMGFVMTLSTDDEPGSYQKRGWKKMGSPNPMMTQYHLPAPVTVYGYTTSDVAFTSSAMLAVIDLADPTALAKAHNVENIIPGAPRFMGEREISDTTEIDKEAGYTFKKRVALNISTLASHPGKTLIGCSYHMDMEPLEK
jgi:hypothetical protein